jgi:polysaccharide export outer membrane protein
MRTRTHGGGSELVNAGMIALGRVMVMAACLALFASPAHAQGDAEYALGPGDKVRITVFNEPDLSRDVQVGVDGKISYPLIGEISAEGKTLPAFAKGLADALETYLRQARVTADIVEYRPFSIIGEVKAPGSYPYSANLTVIGAVARAGGFSDRAAKNKVFIRRANDVNEAKYPLSDSTPVHAGDTIRIGERLF